VKKRLKIVVTGTRGIPNIQGGVETHCRELFPRIAASSADFDILIVRRKNYARDGLTSFQGVSLHTIPNIRKKSLEAIVHTFCAVWAAKWKFKADIVHIHAVGPALLTPFARLLGMKVVFTHHGADYNREKWGKVAKFMLRLGERLGCLFANEVIAISGVIREMIKDKYRRDAHLIHNGVPAPVVIDDDGYLRQTGVERRKYIFAMGRFVPEKNFHALIAAFARLHLPAGYKLVIAGDADIEDGYSRDLKSSARDSGVILTGFIKGDKLHALLSHARLFVIPSSHEGLPIALLEAMGYGLPVLASDIPANKAICLPPSCYFHYGENTVDNLTRALACKLNETTAPAYDLTPYDWDKIAAQTAAVYMKIQDCISSTSLRSCQ
jgi:glycosyltransferase involved in cell wall biosynthesis